MIEEHRRSIPRPARQPVWRLLTKSVELLVGEVHRGGGGEVQVDVVVQAVGPDVAVQPVQEVLAVRGEAQVPEVGPEDLVSLPGPGVDAEIIRQGRLPVRDVGRLVPADPPAPAPGQIHGPHTFVRQGNHAALRQVNRRQVRPIPVS